MKLIQLPASLLIKQFNEQSAGALDEVTHFSPFIQLTPILPSQGMFCQWNSAIVFCRGTVISFFSSDIRM